MIQTDPEELIKDIRRRFKRRARRESRRVKGRVKIILTEGKRSPKIDPAFGAAALARLDSIKLPDLRHSKKQSRLISQARRRYVLGDQEAFVDT